MLFVLSLAAQLRIFGILRELYEMAGCLVVVRHSKTIWSEDTTRSWGLVDLGVGRGHVLAAASCSWKHGLLTIHCAKDAGDSPLPRRKAGENVLANSFSRLQITVL